MSEETYPAGPAAMPLREAGSIERHSGVVSCLLFVHTSFMYVHGFPFDFSYTLFFAFIVYLLGFIVIVAPAGWADRAFR